MKMTAKPSCSRSDPQLVEDAALHHDVQAGRRLVQQHELRPQGQRQRERHPLLHAAGQLVRERLEHPGFQRHHPQQLGCARGDVEVALRQRVPVRGERVRELRLDADHRVERVHAALEHRRQVDPAHRAQVVLGQRGDVLAVERRRCRR